MKARLIFGLVAAGSALTPAFCALREVPLQSWALKGLPRGEGGDEAAKSVPLDALRTFVPGSVQLSLFRAGLIADPYRERNFELCRWVEDKEWWFYTTFDPPEVGPGRRLLLQIGAVTGSARVYLNGSKLGEVRGSFARGVFDLTDRIVKGGKNLLAVVVAVPKRRTKGVVPQVFYGWDFAPRLVPVGIWRPVELLTVGPVVVEAPFIRTEEIEGGRATVKVSLSLKNLSGRPVGATLDCKFLDPEGRQVAGFKRVQTLPPEGTTTLEEKVEVPSPRLWWPVGLGGQPLYEARFEVEADGKPSDRASVKFGIRTVEARPHKGKRKGQYNWLFYVNGRPVFLKGANWVPADQLLDLSRKRYERLLELARRAGINCLRVWGGGLLETDEFYEACDRKGILVWQEFPLACANYPEMPREAFLKNAEDAILRLRNHPSLLLWCGGNEFDPDNEQNKDLIDGLERLCRKLDPTRPFRRASPYRGDEHCWAVWHGLAPLTAYDHDTPFRSEGGLQAPPVMEHLVRFLPTYEVFPPGPTWSAHHAQMGKLLRYARLFGPVRSGEDLVVNSQLAQALGVKLALETCLRRFPACGGCLIWQFNEPWPAICWAVVDHYGAPKPAYYEFARLSQRAIPMAKVPEPPLHEGRAEFPLFVANLGEEPISGTLAARLVAPDGRALAQFEGPFRCGPNSVAEAGSLRADVPGDLPLVVLDLRAGNLGTNRYLLTVSNVEGLRRPVRALVLTPHYVESLSMARAIKPYGVECDVRGPKGGRFEVPKPEELLSGYECVLLEEGPGLARMLGEEGMRRLAEAVKKGLGLILDGGFGGFGRGGLAGTPLEEISPVEMGSDMENESFFPKWADEGHPILRGLAPTKAIYGGCNILKEKEGAKVILRGPDDVPILVLGKAGKGRVVAFASGLRGGWGTVLAGSWPSFGAFAARLFAWAAGRPDPEVASIESSPTDGLSGLPKTSLKAEVARRSGDSLLLRLTNTGKALAVYVRTTLPPLDRAEFFIEPDFLTLLPGESAEVRVEGPVGRARAVAVSAFNAGRVEMPLR